MNLRQAQNTPNLYPLGTITCYLSNAQFTLPKYSFAYDINMIANVLIVEDQLAIQLLLKRVLERHHFNVTLANNGLEGLARLEEQQAIDLIVSDLEMPEMGGLEMLQRIRQHPRLKDIPSIVVTARGQNGAKEKALELGVTRVITKPVNTVELARVCTGLIQERDVTPRPH